MSQKLYVDLQFRADTDSAKKQLQSLQNTLTQVINASMQRKDLGITPIITPIRGGTDGARLSFMGLPCPNLCTGGENYHGKYEYVSIQSMEKIVQLLLQIIQVYQGE